MFRFSNHTIGLFALLIFWAVSGISSACRAEDLRLDLHLEVLEDPQGSLSYEDVAFGSAARQFRLAGTRYNGGFGRPGDVWVRFELPVREYNEGAARFLLLSPSSIDDLQIYQATSEEPLTANDFSHLVTGTSHPYAERPVQGARLAIPVDQKDWPQRVYVRIKTRSPMALTATLFGEREFISSGMLYWFLNGGYFSACLIIAIINLAFWYWLRESYYLLYSIFAASQVPLALWQTGLIFPLAPNTAHLFFIPLHGAALSLGTSIGFLFAIKFLRVEQWSKLVYWSGLAIVFVVGPVHFIAALVGQLHRTLMPTATLVAILSLYPLVQIIRRATTGDRRARVYLLSFTPLNIAALLLVARNFGLVPGYTWVSDVMQMGGAAHLVLMTFGLGYRIRQSEAERHAAEQNALQVALTANARANELVKQRTRELADAKDKIEGALASEKLVTRQQLQFIDMISHEYRTPVAVLRTNIDLLKMAEQKKADVPGVVLRRMSGAVRRLTEIIEVSLHSDRIADSSFALVRRNVNLGALVDDAISLVSHIFPERNISFEHASGEAGLTLTGDMAMLKTAIVNVLDNALKYSAASKPIRVRLSVEGNTTALLEVLDQGHGIPEKDRPHVFDKYYRASEQSDKPGAGVGLYLVEKIVKTHGGSVALHSRLSGTKVAIRLPLDKAATEGNNSHNASAAGADGAGN